MPGTMAVDAANTFTSAIFMGSTLRLKYGTDEPDITKAGERRFDVQVAVTFHPEYGMRPVSEVLSVTCTGTDPGAGVQAGTQIEFDRLRVGWTVPEARDNGRIRGGKPYYAASGIRPLGVRPGKQEQAA